MLLNVPKRSQMVPMVLKGSKSSRSCLTQSKRVTIIAGHTNCSQIQSHFQNKILKMEIFKGRTRCKQHNSGYCKFADKFKLRHFHTICRKSNCRLKTCENRHSKLCKYKTECRRRTSCLYRHVDEGVILNTGKDLKVQNITLMTELKEFF